MFTSPTQRYSDLQANRLIKRVIDIDIMFENAEKCINAAEDPEDYSIKGLRQAMYHTGKDL